MSASLPAAVVFDCDGTLVDTERVSADATREALASMGHELTHDDLAAIVGRSWADNRRYFASRWSMTEDDLSTFAARNRAIARPRFDDPSLVFDDVVEVLDLLGDAGVPLAVCTGSRRAHLDTIVSLAPLRGRFDVAVSADDTADHKPHPAPYLLTLARLGATVGRPVHPTRVAVVEDSEVGVAAAVAAGCWTVAVDRGAGLHDLGAADVVVEHLTVESLRPGH